MLQLDDVSLRFKNKQIIKSISFSVNQGEVVCLLGPSGCGKTTVLRLIAGLEKLHSGQIILAGEVVSNKIRTVEPHKRDVGFLFQDFALFPHLTVAKNIGWGLSNFSKQNTSKRIAEMFEKIRMGSHADKYPHELSGGEQQRVALARALAPDPRLILLDEPFSGLDASLRGIIREETNTILREQGATVVMVTHDPDEAMLMSDKIVLMNEGWIEQIGNPGELYSAPVNAFVARFFGDINYFSGIVEGNFVQTVAGKFPSKNFKNGTRVDVLIRPEVVKLEFQKSNNTISKEVFVSSIKYTGKFSDIRICFKKNARLEAGILARQIGRFPGKVGEKLHLNIDNDDILLFHNG